MKIGTRYLLCILVFASVVFAATPRTHLIDKSHSQINFVAEARFISAHGFFDKWEAEVLYNPQKIEESSFKVTIDAASINTRIQRRDDHLRSKDFLSVAEYPQITFVSKKISKASDKMLNITGDMMLRGVTKEIEVPVEMVFYDNNRGRFRGTFPLNRKDFGITFNSGMNPIEDVVKVQFDINILDKEAVEKQQKARSGSN